MIGVGSQIYRAIQSLSGKRWGAAATGVYKENNRKEHRFARGDLLAFLSGRPNDYGRRGHCELERSETFAKRTARRLAAWLFRAGFAAFADEIGEAAVIGCEQKVPEFGDNMVRQKRCKMKNTQQRECCRDERVAPAIKAPPSIMTSANTHFRYLIEAHPRVFCL
ncbi:hypothetical protein [Hyphomicrobium sp. MC8b]|uniref:hypothetical protein n=1 Tax=Hyphomicrobium sp. MC8b TaxID=300273 RepID=UPI003919663B